MGNLFRCIQMGIRYSSEFLKKIARLGRVQIHSLYV